MAFKTKSRFESAHFTSVSGTAATQLQKALTSDPDHLVPDRMLRRGEAQKLEALRPMQEALNKLFDANAFLDLVRIPQSEIDGQRYGAETERAVLAFKKKLDIRGPGQSQVDPICGRSTLAQLDDEIRNKLEGGGGEVPQEPEDAGRFADVVVDILGFGGNNSPNQGEEQGGRTLKFFLEAGNYKTLNRDLTVIQFTGSGDQRNPVEKIITKVEAALSGRRRGVICIRGESAGGPNALELAGKLLQRRHALAYIGIADGAFSDGQAFPPVLSVDGTIPIPIIKAPPIRAGRRLNIFQSFGNGVTFSFSLRRPIWKGGMPNGEIHGKIQGWLEAENIDLTVNGNIKGGPGVNATIAHTTAATAGNATHLTNIKGILDSQPKS